jgi:hypothetical protein
MTGCLFTRNAVERIDGHGPPQLAASGLRRCDHSAQPIVRLILFARRHEPGDRFVRNSYPTYGKGSYVTLREGISRDVHEGLDVRDARGPPDSH